MIEALTLAKALAYAKTTYGHARSCKTAPDRCHVCQLAIAWYRALPLPLLAQVLQDQPTSHTAS